MAVELAAVMLCNPRLPGGGFINLVPVPQNNRIGELMANVLFSTH